MKVKVLRAFYSNFKSCFDSLSEVFSEVFENMPYGQICIVFNFNNEGAWIYVKPDIDIFIDLPIEGFQVITLDSLEVEEEDAIELKFDTLVPILHFTFVSFAPSPKIRITHERKQEFLYVSKGSLFYGKFFIDKETGFYIFFDK